MLFLLAPSPSLIARINRRLENVKTKDIWSGKAQRSLRRNSLIENCRNYARSLPNQCTSAIFSRYTQVRLPSISLRNAPPPRGNRFSGGAFLGGCVVTSTVGPPSACLVNSRSRPPYHPCFTLSFSSLPVK